MRATTTTASVFTTRRHQPRWIINTMTRAPVILVLMVLLAGCHSRAVPLRAHGGVIFGSDFLRILDPRARPPAHNDPFDTPRATATEQRAAGARAAPRDDTTTLLETPGAQPAQDNTMLSSRHLRKLDPVVSSFSSSSSSSSSSQFTSSSSSSFSSSSSPSTGSVSQHIDSATLKPHPRRMPQQAAAANRLIPDKKLTTSRTNSIKPTTSPVNTLSSNRGSSDPMRPASSSVTSRPENDFNLPLDEYDYSYYYYLEDFYPLASSRHEEPGRTSTTSTTEVSTKASSIRSTEAIPQVGSATRVTQSASVATSTPSVYPSRKTLRQKVEPRQTASATPTLTPTTVRTASATAITPRKTSVPSTTTKRPTTKRSTFRYRTTTESTPKVRLTLENPTSTTHTPTLDPGSRRQSAATESSSASVSVSQETSRTTTTTEKTPPLSRTPKPRTSVTVKTSARSSQPPTTQSPATVDKKTTTLATSKPPRVSTPQPSKPEVEERTQKPKGARGTVPRHFRYTTPIPKKDSVVNATTTQVSSIHPNNTLKSLGSTSSSSVVVEVRVESPRREPRLMAAETAPLVQTISRGLGKVTPAPTKTVHTVHPDRHTTSFLLSDPLVVDVAAEPTTSNQKTIVTPPRRRPAALARSRGASTTPSTTTVDNTPPPTTTTTSTTTTTTTTEAPTTPSQPREPAQGDQVESLTSDKVTRGRNTGVEVETSVVEVSGSVGLDPQVVTKDTTARTRQRGPPAGRLSDGDPPQSQNRSPVEQFQTQRVSTSVSRTEARTAERVSSVNIYERLPQPASSSTSQPSSSTVQATVKVPSNSSQPRIRIPFMRTPRAQQGLAPLGLTPFGEAPEGLAPFGYSPAGLAPHGLVPGGIHPHGLAPHGYGRAPTVSLLNMTDANVTVTQGNGTRLTFVDDTVVDGGADANSTVGYVVEEPNVSRFRLEEKTPDGFIIGEYGVVDHSTGDVNGVRYTADSTADPHLIYETLMKFLKL